MHLAVLGVLIIIAVFGPQMWVRYTLKRFGSERNDLQGTGGELAEHLIKRFELEGVTVHQGGSGEDFYDPQNKLVSLSPEHYHGRSVSAVAVATHEIGHALQDKQQHPGFARRQRTMAWAARVQRISAIALVISPFIFALTRVPHSMLLTVVIGACGMLVALWVQLINLPVELDASFQKALPILEEGYLGQKDLVGARKVLKAAAWTYVAAAIANLLNLGRWIAILRR